jgi:quercetin dioxygenase-like cupin family protein
MEIVRFGPGHRRPEGPPGTQGLLGQVILHDPRAQVTELAFQRYAMITPHSNPTSTALFIVVSGAGWVQVGDERARINHGEAVVWPPAVMHGAYTDGTEMRVIIVELTGSDEVLSTDQTPAPADAVRASAPTPAEGALAERTRLRDEYDKSEGEPW